MFNSFSFGKIKALESGSRIKKTYKTGDRKLFKVTPMPSLTHAISGRFVIQSVESGKELKNLMMLHDGEGCERMRGGDEEEDCQNTKPFQHGLGQCGHTTSSTPSSSLSTSYPFPSPHPQRTLPTTSSYTPVTIWFSGMRFRAVVSKWKG